MSSFQQNQADHGEEEEEYEVLVKIRQIESHDNKTVSDLIFNSIYVLTLNKVLLHNMERPYVICCIGILAIVINWLCGGIITTLVVSVLVVPFVIYIFIRYVLMEVYCLLYLKDLSDVYKYWSAPDEGRTLWVAECPTGIIGCVAIETVSPMVVDLTRLAVSEKYHSMGVGNRLTDYALSHVKRREYREVLTLSCTVNPEASNLFNKSGFKKIATEQKCFGTFTLERFSLKLGSKSSRSNLNAVAEEQ